MAFLGFQLGFERNRLLHTKNNKNIRRNKKGGFVCEGEARCGWRRESDQNFSHTAKERRRVERGVMCRTELTDAAGPSFFHVSHSVDEFGAGHRVTWVPLCVVEVSCVVFLFIFDDGIYMDWMD